MKHLTLRIAVLFLMAMPGHAAETVKIAVIGAKTGDAATDNSPLFTVAPLATDELNQNRVLPGKEIELLELDNQSTALGSKEAAQKAVEAGAALVIGAFWSSHSIAMAPVLQKAQIPMISPSSTNPQVTLVGDFIFRVCFIDTFQGAVMADFAIHDLKAEKAVVLAQAGDTYSTGLAQNFIKKFQEQGGKVLMEGDYLKNAVDFSDILQKIIPLKPDVVFIPGYMRESGFFIRQAKKLGLTSVFLGGDGWSADMYEYGGDAIHGGYFCAHWHEASPNPKSIDFIKKYKNRYGEKSNIIGSSALTYDAVFLSADAVRRANSLNPTLIRDALKETKNFQGITGNISFDKDRNPIKPATILKFDNGSVSFVKNVEP